MRKLLQSLVAVGFLAAAMPAVVGAEFMVASVTQNEVPGTWKGVYNNFCYGAGDWDQELLLRIVKPGLAINGTFATPRVSWPTAVMVASNTVTLGIDAGFRTWEVKRQGEKIRLETSYTYQEKNLDGRPCQVKAWLEKETSS